MDSLALLCTLHADGPATLKKLRQASVTTLATVVKLEIERLAPLLGCSHASARRFQREAQSLLDRVGAGILEREEPVRVSGGGDARAALVPEDRRLLDLAIGRWREIDERDESHAASAAGAEVAEHGLTPLTLGIIDGLDRESLVALQQAGIADLESLADSDAVKLSQETALPFTRVQRLRQLAVRALNTSTRGGAQTEPNTYELRPQAPAHGRERREETAGGPFA
jgi:predicted RecB family nuclease